MTRRSLSGALVALALTLLLPAAVRGEENGNPSLPAFALQASNGYTFVVLPLATGEGEGDEGAVFLYLVRNTPTTTASAAYVAPATVSNTTIDADLGKLGRISVTRVPTGRMKTVRRSCTPGKTQRVEAERYEGTIEFHGEEGFTEVNATSAPLLYATICGSSDGGGGGPSKILPGARLDVEKHLADTYRLEFDAVQNRPGAKTAVKVEVDERRGEMEMSRATSLWASPSALHYSRRLHTATVKPPAPFAGHGSFHANARPANRWTGNLTVDLPGRADVPVTGPGFLANLERPRR